jgi:hypothetical protein
VENFKEETILGRCLKLKTDCREPDCKKKQKLVCIVFIIMRGSWDNAFGIVTGYR